MRIDQTERLGHAERTAADRYQRVRLVVTERNEARRESNAEIREAVRMMMAGGEVSV